MAAVSVPEPEPEAESIVPADIDEPLPLESELQNITNLSTAEFDLNTHRTIINSIHNSQLAGVQSLLDAEKPDSPDSVMLKERLEASSHQVNKVRVKRVMVDTIESNTATLAFESEQLEKKRRKVLPPPKTQVVVKPKKKVARSEPPLKPSTSVGSELNTGAGGQLIQMDGSVMPLSARQHDPAELPAYTDDELDMSAKAWEGEADSEMEDVNRAPLKALDKEH